MALKLYGVPLSPFARMAHAVAELTNNEFEYIKERLSIAIDDGEFCISTRSPFFKINFLIHNLGL